MTTLATAPASPATSAAPIETLADLMERLGGVPPHRIRFRPSPGTAVEQDVLDAGNKGLMCELVDGVLVEKAMGYSESTLAVFLIEMLNAFVRTRNLGLVSGPDGTIRLFPGLVRIPDVAFASWDRLPGGRRPDAPIPDVSPDLAVEVLSRSNTDAEMAQTPRLFHRRRATGLAGGPGFPNRGRLHKRTSVHTSDGSRRPRRRGRAAGLPAVLERLLRGIGSAEVRPLTQADAVSGSRAPAE